MGFTADYTVTPASRSELVFYHTVVPRFTTNYCGVCDLARACCVFDLLVLDNSSEYTLWEYDESRAGQ